ncbi:FGGY-family carbohydrate kinase [Halobacillus litoralis]|uniref:FGGY-family carbohydrate kinase n=1 Tax=Halobacillus litoralis TaxID=45668 RepID=UPI001CD6E50C|nr:FGGY-family carbohydrate kinase [Halobacillus litoralis]MCA1022991.1 sugar kinase [Halobacillus litoralis]
MPERYMIGVDGGSQSTKVVIYDLKGNPVSQGIQELKAVDIPEPGQVEHPEDDLWASLAAASKKAMEQFQDDRGTIIGVGLCTIRFVRCLLKADGCLASPAQSWMDERVSKPYQQENEEVSYVTTSSGYLTHRLTGEKRDSAGNYQGQWPIDTDSWGWSDAEHVYEKYNIPKDMLFDLYPPGTILGYITEEASSATGIPRGLPVVATANDKAVEALGAGIRTQETALISLGTYIAGMVHGGRKNVRDAENYWTNFSSVPQEYLYESEGIRRGMWTVSWFKELLGYELVKKAEAAEVSPEDYLNAEADAHVPPGSDGLLTVLDWLAPTDEPYKKGIMIGFDARHSGVHMYRSILEGIALTMKANMDALYEEMGENLEKIIITGGGSNGDLIMQIFADVFGVPVGRNAVNGAASLGAAINTAIALGVYENYDQAVQKMVRMKDSFSPDMETHEFYARFNDEVYQQVTAYTDPLLKKAHAFFNQ